MVCRIYAAFVDLVSLGKADEWWTLALCSLLTPLLAACIPCIVIYWSACEMIGYGRVFPDALSLPYFFVGYVDHNFLKHFGSPGICFLSSNDI